MSGSAARILILLKTLKRKQSRWAGFCTTRYLEGPPACFNFVGSGKPRQARHALSPLW